MQIRRIPVIALIGLANSLAASSCAPRSNTGYATSPAPPPATTQSTQPAATQSTPASAQGDLVLRPTAKWLWVLKLRQDYLAKEGAAHRGPIFETLTQALNSLAVPVLHIGPSVMRQEPAESLSEREVLAMLGPPDYGSSNQAGSDLAYRFRREGLDVDLVVTISIDGHGRVKRFDWDALSSLRPEFPRLYRRTAGPATRPVRQPKAGDGYIGVHADQVSWIEGRHEYLGLGGVQVREVVPGSPADRAGLRTGDIIEGVDQQATAFETFVDQITRHRPGQTITLTVLPAGTTSWHDRKEITVTLGSRPASTSAPDG
jgi:hypothetical protein